MINKTNSLSAIFLLFLNFIVISRYLQIIKYEDDLSNTVIQKMLSKEHSCKPSDNSLLANYQTNQERVLFILLDSYPDSSLYEELVGKSSNLHNYLKNKSNEYIETSTSIAYTFKSLPFLLGRIDPIEKCRFPFLSGYFKPNLILGTKWNSVNNSLCQENTRKENYFGRIYIHIKNVYKKLFDRGIIDNQKCHLSNKEIFPKIISKFKDSKKIKNNIWFISEMQFHDEVIYKFIEPYDENKDFISNLDEIYFESVKRIIDNVTENKTFDEIIVLNDHGPRSELFGFTSENNDLIKDQLKENSFMDKNYYGVFISRFNINKNTKTNKIYQNYYLGSAVPKAKKRYIPNERGQAILIKEFD